MCQLLAMCFKYVILFSPCTRIVDKCTDRAIFTGGDNGAGWRWKSRSWTVGHQCMRVCGLRASHPSTLPQKEEKSSEETTGIWIHS